MRNKESVLSLEEFQAFRYAFQHYFLEGECGDRARKGEVYEKWMRDNPVLCGEMVRRLMNKYRIHPFGHQDPDDLKELYAVYVLMRSYGNNSELFGT
jgi:hypothetical protein